LFYRLLFAFDAIIAAGFLFFFVWGLSDGSVSSFNLGLWLGTLAAIAGVLLGAYYLNAGGNRPLAIILLLVLAIPGLLYALFVLLIIVANPRWN
jgi:hypothetical protein